MGFDAVELRRINAIKEGEGVAYGVAMNPNGMIECIDKVAEKVAMRMNDPKFKEVTKR